MATDSSLHKMWGVLTIRRAVLLAGVSSLAAVMLFTAPGQPNRPAGSEAVQAAEMMPRPAGFADLVDQVKSSVISIRVKMTENSKLTGMDHNAPSSPKDLPLDRL